MRSRRFVLFISLLFLIIGFSILTTAVILNGQSVIKTSTLDVVFETSSSDGESQISSDGKTIAYNTSTLISLNSESELNYVISNKSTQYTADIKVICESDDKKYNEYLQVIYPNDHKISASSIASGKIKVKLVKPYLNSNELKVLFTCKLDTIAVENKRS